jgi:hypothetical protein
VAAGVGVVVRAVTADPMLCAINGKPDPSMRILCEATIDGQPAYGWLALGWLEPINPQKSLFETAQPQLF